MIIPSWIEADNISRLNIPVDIQYELVNLANIFTSDYKGCYYRDNITPFIFSGTQLTEDIVIESVDDVMEYLKKYSEGIRIFNIDKYSGKPIESRLCLEHIIEYDKILFNTRSPEAFLNSILVFLESEFMHTVCIESEYVGNDELLGNSGSLVNDTYLEYDNIYSYISNITKTSITDAYYKSINKIYSSLYKLIDANYNNKNNTIRLSHSSTTILLEMLPPPSSIRYLIHAEIQKRK